MDGSNENKMKRKVGEGLKKIGQLVRVFSERFSKQTSKVASKVTSSLRQKEKPEEGEDEGEKPFKPEV